LGTTLPRDETLFVVTEAGMGPLIGKGFHYFDVLATMKLNPLMSLEEIITEFYKNIRTDPKFPFKVHRDRQPKRIGISTIIGLHQTPQEAVPGS